MPQDLTLRGLNFSRNATGRIKITVADYAIKEFVFTAEDWCKLIEAMSCRGCDPLIRVIAKALHGEII